MGGSKTTYNYSTTTIRDPDKVKAARIEAEGQIEKAKIEQLNITLRKDAAIELMDHNVRVQKLLFETKLMGFKRAKESLLDFNRQFNLIAEQRFRMMEYCTQDVIAQLNKYYMSIHAHIEETGDIFILEKVPAMLETLERFEPGSDSHFIYKNTIDKHISSFIEGMKDWVSQQARQQKMLVESAINTKTGLNDEISRTVENRMKLLERSLETFQDAPKELPEDIVKKLISKTKTI